MGLFKSKDERRVEREMAVRRGVRSIEKSILDQQRFSEGFIKQAQQAKRIGDDQQYQFIRGSLKKTATIKRMLERQLVAIQSAIIVQKQAQASVQFASSMNEIATEIGKSFGEIDLTKTQAQWERAVTQSSAMEERMGLFLDTMETAGETAGGTATTSAASGEIADAEIDRMIEADVLASEQAELGKLDQLESEIEKELSRDRQRD